MLTPILGARLILNLRDAYYRPFEDEVRQSMLDDQMYRIQVDFGEDPAGRREGEEGEVEVGVSSGEA